ncbi:hypothetical protein [Methylopila sp. 73B]|uniref:hypothetical protein n=1 Tax=Methylopila sp. 73B TaxID=1120792 RepID=UPI00039C8531|nr:hypothetical protein [Methylopila sp. 73B]
MSDDDEAFGIAVPAWRARRLRAHLGALPAAGAAARAAGEPRAAPAETAHRAEARRWLRGWDQADAAAASSEPRPPTPKQLAKLTRWEAGVGRLRPSDGARRRDILEAVAEALLSARPLPFGAIAAAHRETVRRCREAGVPAPKASRYRRWLKLTGRAAGPAGAPLQD